MPQTPYLLSGKLRDNITPRANITLTAINERTGKQITTVSNSLGEFAFDAANFEDDYNDLDFVRILSNTTGTNGTDLRLRFVSRGIAQIEEIKAEYTIRS